MFAAKLGRGDEREQLVARKPGALKRQHLGHARLTFGDGARLVEHAALHARQPLQRIAFLHQKAVLGGVADGCDDGGRRGQHERAGAEHHEHRDCAQDFPGDKVHACSRGQRAHDDPGGPAVGQAHDFRLARVGALHQARHAADGAVFAHARGDDVDGAELVDRAGGHLVAGLDVARHRLAGHCALVDAGRARDDPAVNGDGLARQHAHDLVELGCIGVDFVCGAIGGDYARPPGRQLDEPLDAALRALDGQLLQEAAELHDERHLAGSEILADADRRDERERHQKVGLHVEFRDDGDECLDDDGCAA